MSEFLKNHSGQLIAKALAGSWRSSVGPPQISSAELSQVAQLLIQAGAGALVWRRIRDFALGRSKVGAELQVAYRLHRLEAGVHQKKISMILARLRAAGIDPVLVKGWAAARLYPEAGLRHYVDVDLCVGGDEYSRARQVLAHLGDDGLYVDLHKELDHLDVMDWDEFFSRSLLLTVDDTEIRVPCAEDHLRILCIHWLRHGAWKPAGLCDVAAALESRPVEFDWQRCLGADPVRAGWVACTIGLAHDLLGAEVSGKREGESGKLRLTSCPSPLTRELPRWLVPAVLRQWGRSLSPNYREPALPALFSQLTNWKEFAGEFFSRLDQPVRATVALRGRFNNLPRWPYQLGEVLLHSFEVPKQSASMIVRAAGELNSSWQRRAW